MINQNILYLNKQDIKRLDISMRETIKIVETTFKDDHSNNVHLPAKIGIHPNEHSFFHAMPALIENIEGAGIKWVSYYPNNQSSEIPDSSCIMILNDTKTGLPISIMEALHLTYKRTSASGATAVKWLAKPESKILSIIGAGTIARWSVDAILEVMPSIEEIRVSSRTEKSRLKFCDEMSENYKHIRFIPYDNSEEIIEDADVVLSITSNTGEPFINFDLLKNGGMALSLDGIMSWNLSFKNADLIVSDEVLFLESEMQRKYGEVALGKDVFSAREIIQKNELVWDPNKRSIAFMSGIGSIDIALGKVLYDKAVKNNIGKELVFP